MILRLNKLVQSHCEVKAISVFVLYIQNEYLCYYGTYYSKIEPK
jgi:hypothetical protein